MSDTITNEEKNKIEESYLASVSGKETDLERIKEKFFKNTNNTYSYSSENNGEILNIPKRIGKEKIGEKRLS